MDKDFWDSTSTNPRYKPGDLGMSESEGLGYAMGNMFETGARMLDPVEALKGVGTSVHGLFNDGFRALGGNPGKDQPSFFGGLKDSAQQIASNPARATFDMVTAPGSIPAIIAGSYLPKIPKGTGYKTVSPKPGTRVVREKLKGVGVYDYIPQQGVPISRRNHRDVRERRRPSNYLDSDWYRNAQFTIHNNDVLGKPSTLLDLDKINPKRVVERSLNEPGSNFSGKYITDLDSFVRPRRNHEYRFPDEFHEVTGGVHKIDDKWVNDISRHERIHAINQRSKVLGQSSILRHKKRQLPKVVRTHLDEAKAYTGHHKSLTQGLDHMGTVFSRGEYGKAGRFTGPAIKGASKVMKGLSKPGMMTGVVPYIANKTEEDY